MPWNVTVTKVVAMVIVLAKLHNFCIGESDTLACVLQVLDRDRYHMMNVCGGYVGLCNNNPQQNAPVLNDLLHLEEHFNKIQDNLLWLHQQKNARIVLPQMQLFQMIVDDIGRDQQDCVVAGRFWDLLSWSNYIKGTRTTN